MAETEANVLLFAGPFQLRGTCAYTLKLMHYLPEHGYSLRVACTDAQLLRGRKPAGVSVREVPRLNVPLIGRVVRRYLLKELSATRPVLIHVQSRHVLEHGAWLATHLQCPYLVTVHDYLRDRETFSVDRTWCRKVIAVSDSVKEDLLLRSDLPDDFVQVVHTGVDHDRAEPARTTSNAQHVPVVGTGGAAGGGQRIPVSAGSGPAGFGDWPGCGVSDCGGWSRKSSICGGWRGSLKIADKVTFVPHLLDFGESLSAMDVFCLPSLQQGLGTIMLEAMAMGKPVIATGVGGVYSVVHDQETGLLVPPSNSTALAERLMELLDDPGLCSPSWPSRAGDGCAGSSVSIG